MAALGSVVLMVVGGTVIERYGKSDGQGDIGGVLDIVGGVVFGVGIIGGFGSLYFLRPEWFTDRRGRDHR